MNPTIRFELNSEFNLIADTEITQFKPGNKLLQKIAFWKEKFFGRINLGINQFFYTYNYNLFTLVYLRFRTKEA